MIGTPIAQARAPLLFNRYFAERGEDRVMVPADAITDPLETEFLRNASACGHWTVNGQAMTLGQFEHLRALIGV